MKSIFSDDFFDDLLLGFGRPLKIIFNTNNLKDQMPTCWEKTDSGYRCTAKTLGISEVKVSVEDYGIKVFGESELEGKKYNTTLELPISQDVMDNVTEINTKTINGITFIDLIVDRPERRKIKINGK